LLIIALPNVILVKTLSTMQFTIANPRTADILYIYPFKYLGTHLGNLPDNVATINYRIESVARSEAIEYRIFTLYFIHT
jgi:hypothetical protein